MEHNHESREPVINVDPKYFGPGIWWCLHQNSLRAITTETKLEFRRFLNDIVTKIWCKKCRFHATKYINENPIEEYDQLAYGYFTYVWNFHNIVNKRLGKPEMNWQTAYKLYTNQFQNVCQHGCNDHEELKNEITSANVGVVADGIEVNFVSPH